MAKSRTRKTAADVPATGGPWKFVEIVWIDARSDSSWCKGEDLPDVAPVQTRGWLVRKTAKCVTIAASQGMDNEDPDIGEVITIPRGTIETIKELVDADWKPFKL